MEFSTDYLYYFHYSDSIGYLIFVFRKPLARLVVPKSLSEEADKKTPFAIIRLRSANCNRKQKEDIQDGTE